MEEKNQKDMMKNQHYRCTKCGYIVTATEWEQVKIDPICRCGEKWSMFKGERNGKKISV